MGDRYLLVLVGLVLVSLSLVCGNERADYVKKMRGSNLPLAHGVRRPLSEPQDSSSNDAAFSYFYYCLTGCKELHHPDETDVYLPQGCVPTNFTNTEFFHARCSADNSEIIITYYSDDNCQSDPLPEEDSYPTETCILPPHSYEATAFPHCRPKPPTYASIRENYYQKSDVECVEPIFYSMHAEGCVESCPDSWVYGAINTTKGEYNYLNGCEARCPANAECGIGRSGYLQNCIIDEYTLLPRLVDVL